MSDKEVFTLLFEYENSEDESYEVVLEKYDENTYSDGNKYFHLSEKFIYLIENKGKKKKVAKRKGKNLVLSNKKDKIVFSPDVVIQQNLSRF